MTFAELKSKVKDYTKDYGHINWGDTFIGDLLNEGYADFVRRTECLRKNNSIAITPKTYTFSLPSDCIKPYRFEYLKARIPLVTDDYMDSHVGYGWREATGTSITAVVQQMTGPSTIRIYPIFEDFSEVIYTIDDTHNKMIFSYDAGAATTITLDNGTYDGDEMAEEIADEIDDAFGITSTVSFSSTTGKFSITVGSSHTITFTYSGSTAAPKLGFTSNEAAAQTITGDESVRLFLDYVYYPTAMSNSTNGPSLPEEYHIAIFYYAMNELMKVHAGKDKDFLEAIYYENKYGGMVHRMRNWAGMGFGRAQHRMRPPRWV